MIRERIKSEFKEYANRHPDQVAWLTRLIIDRPRVVIHNQHILREVRDMGEYASFVYYFVPHGRKIEPAVITQRVIKPLVNPVELAWWTSGKWTVESDQQLQETELDKEIPPIGVGSKVAPHYARLLNFRLLTMVQTHLKKGLSARQQKIATDINFSSIREGKRILTKPGAGVALSPESHRNNYAGLQRAQEGVELLFKHNPIPVLAVPIILNGVDRFQLVDRDGEDSPLDYNPLATIDVNIGHPITYEEAKTMASRYEWVDPEMGNFTVADGLMMHAASYGLREVIPGVDPRGVYAWENIRTTNRIETGFSDKLPQSGTVFTHKRE